MSLQILWFWLICVLWSGYFVLEGFDFGVGALLPWLGREERDERAMIESIGPVWDGNEVWLVTAAGATFAAFPVWYATMFSGLYIALLLILVLLILRVLSFEWRGKAHDPRWRSFWTWANTVASVGAPLIWGIAFANLLQGLPINDKQEFTGDFWDIFSPYTVFAGLTFVLLFTFHGAVFLLLRTTGDLFLRARHTAARLGPVAVLATAAFLVWTVVIAVDVNDKSAVPGGLLVALAVAAAVVSVVAARAERDGLAFGATALTIVLAVVTLFAVLYPRVMVSSTDFANSLTVQNASSAHYTLTVISIATAVLLPVVMLYQGWTYRVFRARVGGEDPGLGQLEAMAPPPPRPAPDREP